jgi:hypothetical protein
VVQVIGNIKGAPLKSDKEGLPCIDLTVRLGVADPAQASQLITLWRQKRAVVMVTLQEVTDPQQQIDFDGDDSDSENVGGGVELVPVDNAELPLTDEPQRGEADEGLTDPAF